MKVSIVDEIPAHGLSRRPMQFDAVLQQAIEANGKVVAVAFESYSKATAAYGQIRSAIKRRGYSLTAVIRDNTVYLRQSEVA